MSKIWLGRVDLEGNLLPDQQPNRTESGAEEFYFSIEKALAINPQPVGQQLAYLHVTDGEVVKEKVPYGAVAVKDAETEYSGIITITSTDGDWGWVRQKSNERVSTPKENPIPANMLQYFDEMLTV